MRRPLLIILGVLLSLLVAGLAVTLAIRHNGLAADRQPGRIETAVARRLVLLSIPTSQRNAVNPLASNADAWRDGAEHFGGQCAVCHGPDGKAHTQFAAKMYPPVPDLSSDAIQQQFSDGALFSIIQNGVSWTGMPAFRSAHSAEETWKLVSFIRRMPTLTAADLQHSDPANHDAVRGADQTIAIDGTSFTPMELTVAVGDTVAWVNRDPFPHNVTSSAGGFGSDDLDPDTEWRFTATKAGTFPYVCTLHPGMKGVITVR